MYTSTVVFLKAHTPTLIFFVELSIIIAAYQRVHVNVVITASLFIHFAWVLQAAWSYCAPVTARVSQC